ncbi:alpha/beta hydrolase [Gilvimarinus xylanilyticus]|uniref:Alpha/beta hydrolase n=1 Tax=Gilvimarinus xylanilyticus TaxID=2944139 RepID=A0A9X2KSL9_9GAMM|nr:alpha/beta hydrolase [Gilvimarinus xylanilyticus]MCP8898257.1 alpha/beta hydrolase [Gilvimarinus xylanilyticus]
MRFSFSLILLLICGVTPAQAAENTYTAENTLAKYSDDYPFISIASINAPASVLAHKDIAYVSDGERRLHLDLYRPAETSGSPTPGVILVHGGGWQAGYRTHLTPIAIKLAEAGIAAATISYRLAPEALYPAAIYDTKAALRWMRANAGQYHINPEQLAVAGSSAGGQIASLTGVTNGLEEFDPQAATSKVSSDAQLIINIDGLSDFTSEKARKYEDAPRDKPSSAVLWLGGHYAQQTERWHEASPIYYVNQATPPILFLASGRTRFYVGRDEMIRRLNQHGIPSKVVTFSNTPHSFWLFDPWMQPAASAIAAFIKEQFAAKI